MLASMRTGPLVRKYLADRVHEEYREANCEALEAVHKKEIIHRRPETGECEDLIIKRCLETNVFGRPSLL